MATMLGQSRWARRVGYALAALTDESVPWHRVVNAQGRVSAPDDVVRGVMQRRRLEAEGVVFDPEDRLDLDGLRYDYPGVRVG